MRRVPLSMLMIVCPCARFQWLPDRVILVCYHQQFASFHLVESVSMVLDADDIEI